MPPVKWPDLVGPGRRGEGRRLVRPVACVGLALAVSSAASAQSPPPLEGHFATVISYVRDVGRRSCASLGSGLAVGNGLVLTAGHVLLDRSDLTGDCQLSPAASRRAEGKANPLGLSIRSEAGKTAEGDVVAKGQRSNGPSMGFAGSEDFAIVRTPLKDTRPLEPCPTPPMPGHAVTVLLEGGPVLTAVAWVQSPKSGEDEAYLDLSRVFENGSSGAGVLDPKSHCVLGIVSHRFPEPTPKFTRITPIGVFAEAWKKALAR